MPNEKEEEEEYTMLQVHIPQINGQQQQQSRECSFADHR